MVTGKKLKSLNRMTLIFSINVWKWGMAWVLFLGLLFREVEYGLKRKENF